MSTRYGAHIETIEFFVWDLVSHVCQGAWMWKIEVENLAQASRSMSTDRCRK